MVWYRYMPKLQKILAVGCVCALLCGLPFPAQAQKWNIFKKLMQPQRLSALTVVAQAKIRRVLWRAALRQRPEHFRTVTQQNGNYLFFSPKALLPKPIMLHSSAKIPLFPFQENEKEMYRGMRLDADGKQLRHILHHGLQVSQSHYYSYASYDGKKYPPGTKAIYASMNPHAAIFYATSTEAKAPPFLPVILHLKRVGWTAYVSIPHDIPPSWIYRVSALLKINGRLVWGELKLNKQDHFVFTPYK